MWEIAKMHGEIDDDWNSFTFYAPSKIPFTSKLLDQEDIVALYKKAYRSFYLRPKFILKQLLSIRSFTDIQRRWIAVKGVLGL
jgi:hypothetical protein